MRLALYQPDIPQNTGTILRTAACLNVGVDIIEPCGFILDDKRLKRSGMDYIDNVDLVRHISWSYFRNFCNQNQNRIVLLTTSGNETYCEFSFKTDDCLLLGSESRGVTSEVHETATARIKIPMAEGSRSLNVAVAASMVLGEALRQTNNFITNVN